ncbi:IclR family transcriptional regulator [Mycobacterium vulneris]|nr:IclR family transcriptional regulator [Mycolicibacterium vulneris]OCB61859.1 IclR family transcriptional regulator [Mycolicibacterium vulneris]
MTGDDSVSVRKVKSAVRTVELLEFLAARPDEPTRIREICAALDMPRSSAHALLRTLVAQGWVRSDDAGTQYSIGMRALLVGTSYLDADPYLPMIAPFLEDLRAQLDETFHLGRLDGHDVVYLATRESRQYVRTANKVGRRLPAYATALGKALLAERFGAELDAHIPDVLTPLTPRTLTDRAGLDVALDEARVRGYATEDEENTLGIKCFAVTLRYRHPAQDAISASVPLSRLTPEREREIVDALRLVCDKVSRVVRPVANGDKWFA